MTLTDLSALWRRNFARPDAALEDRREEFQLSALMASVYAIVGVQLPFFPVWLGARGLSATEIAAILATPPALRIVSTLVSTRLGDRSGKHAAFLLFHLFAVALVFAGMGFLSGFWPLLGAVGLLAFAQGPINSLADGMILGAVRRRSLLGRGTLHYSFVRGWGSFAILVVMLAGGPVAAALPSGALIFLLAGVATLGALGGLTAVNGLRAAQAPVAPSRAEPLARPGLVVLVILAAALILASHALSFGFAALHWKAEGFSATFLSLAWVAAVAAEVGFFFLAGRWFGGERKAAFHLTAAGAAAVLRWLIMASDPGAAGIIATQALHGLSCAAAQLGPAYLLARLAGASRLAQAQGWLAATYSAIQALTTLSCGPVYTLYGERSYFAMAAMAAAGLSLALVVMRSADVPAPPHPRRDGPDAS